MHPTTHLARILDRLHRRMTRLVWVHGLSTIAAATAGLLLLVFLLDWSLHVPRAVRWIHLLGLAALPAYLALRLLVRPLRSRPDRTACAVLIERAHPELREIVVTAAELERGPRPASDPALAEGIRREAEQAVERLDLAGVLDPNGPRLRLFLGSLASVTCAAVLVSNPAAARVFFLRLLGGNAAWPQRTHLSIEVSGAGAAPSPVPAPGEPLEVRVARGSDVPVVVRAEGAIPEEVTLHFSAGQRSVIASSGGDTFRTLLRSVQENLEMYATGGDDTDEEPTVRLVVLRPPDIVGLALAIEPPAYSGLSPETVAGGDAEVLAGSRIVVHVLPDPPDAAGRARLLPEDRLVDLASAPFPDQPDRTRSRAEPGAAVPQPVVSGLAFSLSPVKTLRYRIELVDASQLSNPDPGLFAITVVEDRAPDVEILSPGRGDFDTVAGGSLSLRARVRDDFGIARVSYSAVPPGGAGRQAIVRELEARHVLPGERSDERARERMRDDRGAPAATGASAPNERPERAERGSRGTPIIFRAIARTRARIEIAEIAGPDAVAPGAQIELTVSAADNHQPAAFEGKSAPLRIRVVSTDEYLRRLQDRLGRVRSSAAALSELQRAKQRSIGELIGGLESDALLSGDARDEIFAAATGERRVEGDARSLSRDLCSALEGVLYARVDDRAGPLLERVDARLAESDRTFDPEVWRAVASEERAASGAPSGLADRLLRIAALALEVSEVDAPAATSALSRAQDATDPARAHAELTSAAASQKAVVGKIENLLEMLAEWDNYQSVLSLTRDILNGQKSLEERTKAFAKEH